MIIFIEELKNYCFILEKEVVVKGVQQLSKLKEEC